MHALIDIFLSHVKEALFRPKDFFERSKRKAATGMLLPLILIVGAESIFVGILGAIKTIEFGGDGFFFRLLGSASDSFLYLSIAILLAFGIHVGSNLYYAKILRDTAKETEELARNLKRTEAYSVLKRKFSGYLETGDHDRAFTVAALMAKRYPDEVDMDGQFLESILEAVDTPRLKEVQHLLLETDRDDRKS